MILSTKCSCKIEAVSIFIHHIIIIELSFIAIYTFSDGFSNKNITFIQENIYPKENVKCNVKWYTLSNKINIIRSNLEHEMLQSGRYLKGI